MSLIERYRMLLPLPGTATPVSLAEGSTPLYQLRTIPKKLGIDAEIFAKFEGANPTGSFKDRGMTVAVTQAVLEHKQAVLCASTGNTSASAAAYAARAGIKAIVIIPEGKIAYGKLAQALAYGATVLQIDGNFDLGLQLVREIAQQMDIALVNSVNPYRLQGQKTIAFEVIDEMGDVPDYHYLPVGNAGNISAHWMGYQEYHKLGKVNRLPVMVGYQAEGAAPLVQGVPVDDPETVATAIRIGKPASWDLAVAAQQHSNGWFASAADTELLAAQQLLGHCEGIFCEPASAISLAGVIKDWQAGKISAGSKIVCTLTGNGLKDPDVITKNCQGQLIKVAADLSAVRAEIDGVVSS